MNETSDLERTNFRHALQSEISPAKSVPLLSRRMLVASTVALALAVGALVTLYNLSGLSSLLGTAFAETKTGTQSQLAPGQPATPFMVQAEKSGLKTCKNLFETLGQALSANTEYSTISQWNKDDPNGHAVQSLVGLKYDTPSYKALAAGVVLVAPVGETCEGGMIRVAPYAQDCAAVAKMLPSESAATANLRDVNVFDLSTGGQALLIPMQAGCIAITVATMAG